MSEPAAIGIDLGTSYFRVGIYRDVDRFEIICNEHRKKQTPCYVALIGDKWVVGDVAKHRANEDIENTFYSSKRMIGRPHDEIKKLLLEYKHWPFEINAKNTSIKVNGEKKAILPIEISARILFAAREMAESHLKREVKKAVLTVPECFTEQQRKATLLAGTLAGLEVLDIISDPMAAAISYLHASEAVDAGKNACILVLSVGGGSYDVSIVSLKDDNITTLYKTGSANLGGQDFDAALCEFFSKKMKTRIKLNKCQSFIFHQECMKAKESLAQCQSINFSGEQLDKDVIFSMKLEHFKNIDKLKDFVSTINSSIAEALAQAAEKGYIIDEIVYVGGCTRIKSIQECLLQAKVPISHILDVDEAVVQGAAYHAYELCAGGRLLVNRSLPYDNAPDQHSLLPRESDVAEIQSAIEKEREILKQNKKKEAEMYTFETLVYRRQNELKKAGCQEKDLTKSCTPFIEWISENRSSASVEEIHKISDEFCASVKKINKKAQQSECTSIGGDDHQVKTRGTTREGYKNNHHEEEKDKIIHTLNMELQQERHEHQQTKTELQKANSKIKELQRQIKVSKEMVPPSITRQEILNFNFTSCATQFIKIGKFYYVKIDNQCNAVAIFDSSNSFQYIGTCSYHLYDFTLAAFHEEVMLIGGYDEKYQAYSNSIAVWNQSTNSLNTLRFPAMPTKRADAIVTVHENYILVAGGMNDSGPLSNIEVFDANQQRWFSVSSLPFIPSRGIKHAVDGSRWFLIGEKVYYVSLPELIQNDTENLWKTLCDTPLKYPGMATINGYIFAVGGHPTENKTGKEIYYYRNQAKGWIYLCHLGFAAEICSCIFVNDNTLLVCGLAGNAALISIQF